ncbi:sulfurtransferase [Flavobacterium rhizosphaerae]|uniref:Sulfurtransferase n=1 Tax=Flavobacterium rhizosphaerae TaxID=3163298 RepID=A0ABW8YZV4_9FLAO
MPQNNLQALISASHLKNLNPQQVVLVDAGSGDEALERYKKQHLTGAVYIDLNRHLSAQNQNAALGGRHPLPDIIVFSKLLGNMGITPNTHIVVYDDKGAANAAARFWWVLTAMGHAKVQVLNVGLQAALKAGIKVSSSITAIIATHPYPVTGWQLKTVTFEEVENATVTKDKLIIDVRDAARYNGITEPIDPVAGCITGAVNFPFKDNLDEDGLFLSPLTLKEKYGPLFEKYTATDIIVHCGSGVTACHTLLAIAYAGLPIPALYIGSWSEWCRKKLL